MLKSAERHKGRDGRKGRADNLSVSRPLLYTIISQPGCDRVCLYSKNHLLRFFLRKQTGVRLYLGDKLGIGGVGWSGCSQLAWVEIRRRPVCVDV